MNYRKLAKGELPIPAIERDFPEFSGWSEDLLNPELRRCDVCKQIEFDKVSQQVVGSDGKFRGPKHHKSWAQLKAAAVAGCQLCKLFYFVKSETDSQSEKRKETQSSEEQLYISRFGSFFKIGTSFWDEIRFEIRAGDDFPQDPAECAVNIRQVENNPASEVAFARVQQWIEYCKAHHPHCVLNEDVPLPTRVLDVRHSTSPDYVRLCIPKSQHSNYVSLSHCWGNSSRVNDQIIRSCTLETFEELKSGINISRLPKTFQDAITVTQKLGIRYLWIDSLCIMQDSREDWSCESARMSEVYGNSFLTILASTAQNSEQGFLGERDWQRSIKTRFCPHPKFTEHWTWICWPGSEGTTNQARSPRKIQSRAWAFQEYALPPRVLEYAPEEMEWHCNQVTFEESMANLDNFSMFDTYKQMLWILSLPEIQNPPANNQVLKHPEYAGSPPDMSIYSRWYTLVEGYTARDLTFKSDRLPAISGIARKIQEVTSDFYMAGLWKKDLGAGLCWRIRGIGDLHHLSTYRAPSWSWASVEGCITHSIPENHRLSANLTKFNIVTDKNNPLGEVSSAAIVLLGLLRKLRISQGTVNIDHIEYDEVVHHWSLRLIDTGEQGKRGPQYLYALRNQECVRDPRGTGLCIVYFDFGVPIGVEEIILLQLLAEGFDPLPVGLDQQVRPYGIVLEKVNVDGNVYRRIGAYSIVDADAPFITSGMEHAGLEGWSESTVTLI